jgi:hypothetical protein
MRHPNAVVKALKSMIRLLGPGILQAVQRLMEIADTSSIITNVDDAYTTSSTLYVCIPTLHEDYKDLTRRRFADSIYPIPVMAIPTAVDFNSPYTYNLFLSFFHMPGQMRIKSKSLTD